MEKKSVYFLCLFFVSLVSLFPQNQEISKPQDTASENAKKNQEKENLPVWRLEEQVVTPTGNSEKQFKQPYVANILNQKDLQNEKIVRTVPEALKEVPGIMIQKTSHGQGSPFIRGFTGFRTLFLMDGIRLNNSVFREGPNQYWNTVDYLAINKLEVVKGPSSTLYGSDAIGGTVNAISKSRDKYDEPWEINPRAYYRFGSSGTTSTARIEASGNYGDTIGAVGGFYYKYFGDMEAGSDTDLMPRTGYYELGGDIHYNFFLSERAELEFAYYILEQNNVWRTHKTIYSKSFHGTIIGDEKRRRYDQSHQLAYTSLNLSDLTGFFQKAKFTASWQLQKEEEDRLRANNRRDIQDFEVNTLGLQAQATSETSLGIFTYGIEYYRDFVDSSRIDYNSNGTIRTIHIQGPVGDDANYDLLGVYIQNEFTLWDIVTFTLGGRYTHAWLNANQVEDPVTGNGFELSDNWGAFTGNFRFSIQAMENLRIFGGISQGFRSPNLSDMTRFDSARSQEIETPVTGLNPENFLQYEIGAKINYKDAYLQGSYYYTQIFNMIIRYPTGRIINGLNEVTKNDDGEGFIHGVEMEAGYYITSEWLVYGSFSWLEGIISNYPTSSKTKKDSPIDKMQPAMGWLGIKWTHPSQKYWAEGVVNLVRHQYRLSPGDKADTQRIPPGGTPGYATVSIRGGVKINDNVTISASIENIGDKDYRVHGSGQNESGINAIFAIDAKL